MGQAVLEMRVRNTMGASVRADGRARDSWMARPSPSSQRLAPAIARFTSEASPFRVDRTASPVELDVRGACWGFGIPLRATLPCPSLPRPDSRGQRAALARHLAFGTTIREPGRAAASELQRRAGWSVLEGLSESALRSADGDPFFAETAWAIASSRSPSATIGP